MRDQQIKDLTNILHLNYDMPEEFAKDVAEFLYDEGCRVVPEGKWLVPEAEWIVESSTSVRCSNCSYNRVSIKMPLDHCPMCGARLLDILIRRTNMRVTTTYKYPENGTRNGRVYSPEVLKKAFEEPSFRLRCITKSIPVIDYDDNKTIGFATAYLEDGTVVTVDASVYDPTYIAAFKELSKSTDSFGFTLAGSGLTDCRDGKTYITDATFDKAYVFTKDLAVDCHTIIYKED